MKNEQHNHGDAGLAGIWRNANHRRAEDIRWWLIKILKKLRPFKSRAAATRMRLGETLLKSGDSSFAPGKSRMTGGQSGS